MRFLAFAVALLLVALPAASAGAHDNPIDFGHDSNQLGSDPDHLPNPNASALEDVLGDHRGSKNPGGLGSIRVAAGGKPAARAVFASAVALAGGYNPVSKTYANLAKHWEDADDINSIICTASFKSSGNATPANPALKRIHYQEHKGTGLAWLQYELDIGAGPGTPRRAHRIIFLKRICTDTGSGLATCAADKNTSDTSSSFVEVMPVGQTPGTDFCNLIYPDQALPKGPSGLSTREFGDGGGGGEM